jgi:hypothetical protein
MNPEDDEDIDPDPRDLEEQERAENRMQAALEAPWTHLDEEEGQQPILTDEERAQQQADYENFIQLEFPGLID